MFHTARIVLLSAVALLFTAGRAQGQPLPTDPALVTGELANGLRYIVRQHAYPPGRAAMWVHFHSGSLNETDPQRGLAHYLEHLAFNGSENFPPGSVVPFFQSLGMTFGRDQNAFTSFEQTTYQLSLPNVEPETIAKGLTFFADVTGRLLLLPEEIDAERQIIQEERRRGLSGRQRTGYYVLERIAPGSLYGQRIPIGTEETINSVKQGDFRAYYDKWYGASNATLIVIADTDPATIVKTINETFGDLPKKPRPTPHAVNVAAYDRSFAIVASDPEVQSESITVTRLEPARPPTTTVAQFRDDLVDRLGGMAMNRRFDDKVARGGTAYLSARVGTGNDANAIYSAEISASSAAGNWKAALAETALEVQRGRAFGFTAREIDDAKKEIVSNAERAVETEATLPAAGFLRRINSDVTTGEPTLSAAQRLGLLNDLLPSITPDEISQRFAKEFDPTAVCFTAVLPSGPSVPTEAELLQVGLEAFAAKPTPEAETAHATKLMETLPPQGTIKSGSLHAASKVWSGWLNNGVRVHFRQMDEQKNEVSVSISLIGGTLLENAENRGISQAAQIAWSRPATKRLSSTDIRELMTGKKINVRGGGGGMGGGRGGGGRRGGGGSDGVTLTISGSPAELETGFQLAHLMLTEPKIESAAFEQFKTRAREGLQESLKNPMMFGMRTAMAAPYPDDEPRTRPLVEADIDRLKVEAAQAWLEKLIHESPIEVVIVGDIPQGRALELAAQYLGSLPTREPVSPETYAALRKLARPTGPRFIEKSLETPTPQAFVMSGFYGADETNIADVRALSMASRILSTRMVKEVREEGQLVYSIGAQSRAASTYPGFGVFSANAPTDPAKVTALVEKLASMYAAFAKDGPTDEELDVAKKQMANTFDEQLREPGYWSGVLDQLTFRAADLDNVVGAPAAYQALTAAQVKDTFARYYTPQNTIVVVVRPTTPSTPGDGKGSGSR